MNHPKPTNRRERGAVLILGAFALFAVLAVCGLAIDSGRYYAVRAELAKAVDAGALAGARVVATGQENAAVAAEEYAEMNFRNGYMQTAGHAFNVSFNPDPESAKVLVQGTAEMPTTFLMILGLPMVTVRAVAEAERPPLSVALVLDNSHSLHPSFAGINAIGYLRTAAADFLDYFSDTMDQMALVLFSTGTEIRFSLGHSFHGSMHSVMQNMTAIQNTNLADGMDGGLTQLRGDQNPASRQAIVYFTDGRPTALRGIYNVDGENIDGVITCDQNPSGNVDDQLFEPDDLHQAISGAAYTANVFPDGSARTVANLILQANQRLRTTAAQARSEGITVYTIGLGNPNQPEVWKQPDAALLIELANVPSGIDPGTGEVINNPSYDPSQPEGGFYFAPDATQLSVVFDQVARDIVLRLTQ
jgi:hypothetical protein